VSTVLWGNLLVDGEVICDQEDKHALYKYSKNLDKLRKNLSLTSFIKARDFTDMRFNVSGDELPDGMESADQLMAMSGNWISIGDAEKMLSGLLEHILEKKIKFGLLGNDHDQVVSELKQIVDFIKSNKHDNAMFNFSVVM
jgi:hypothetical protein